MIKEHIEGATNVLKAPDGWKPKECGTLPVRIEELDGYIMMTSAWSPTPEELVRLNAGASVLLHILSSEHPPVKLTVGEAPK